MKKGHRWYPLCKTGFQFCGNCGLIFMRNKGTQRYLKYCRNGDDG